MIRSMLFVPGNREDMLSVIDNYAADSVIIDMEDTVPPDQKEKARLLVRTILQNKKEKKRKIIVRINSLDTAYWQRDLQEIMPIKPDIIMLAKSDSATGMEELSVKIAEEEENNDIKVGSTKILPLLESALGIENAFLIATADSRIMGLFLGAEDFTRDLHAQRTKESKEIFYARTRLVCAARAAGIEAYDTPFTDIDDIGGLKADALFAKQLGFTGKATFSPQHAQHINEVFTPTAEQIQYAQEVIKAVEEGKRQGKGTVALKGKLLDKPMVERAKQVIANARELGVIV